MEKAKKERMRRIQQRINKLRVERTTENNSADAGRKKGEIPANKCHPGTAQSSGATKEGSKEKKEVSGPKSEHREEGKRGLKGQKRKKDLQRRKQTFAMHHEMRREGREEGKVEEVKMQEGEMKELLRCIKR